MDAREIAVPLPLAISRAGPETLQKQIADRIRCWIVDSQLAAGTRLTSIRELAQQLEVSVNTVRLAYQDLVSEGYLATSAAIGTFVSQRLPDEAALVPGPTCALPRADRHARRFPPFFRGRGAIIDRSPAADGVIDFWAGRTDPRSFPVQEWRRLVNLHLQRADGNLTDYGPAGGLPALRRAIADHLGRARGFRPDPRQVVVTGGIQQALCIAAMLLLAPGSGAVTEQPGYRGATAVLRGFGAHIIRVPVDADGLIVGQLPEEPAALVYVTPSHQHPTGHVLSMARRRTLLDWSARNGAYVVEDDYDSDFCFETGPLPALASLDARGSVIYLGTFSKTLGAGLRLGYMVLPDELVDAATNVMAMFSFGHAWLDQAVMADYIDSGCYARRLRQLRHSSQVCVASLQDALHASFGAQTLAGPSCGMHLVWHLPPEMPPASLLCAAARRHGVLVYSPEAGGADVTGRESENERMLVFGYASLTPEEIREGIRRLALCLA